MRSATVARTWYQLASAKLREQIIHKQIETNQKILEVIKVQFSQDMDEASLKGRVVLRYAGRPRPGDRA